MLFRLGVLSVFAAGLMLAGDWNPRLAANYLDARQKQWFDWPAASAGTGSACISCHTNLPYLVARPALRRALGESQPTPYEARFLEVLRTRAEKQTAADMFPKSKDPSQAAGAETIFTAWILSTQEPKAETTRLAFDRMWSMQIRDGKSKGSWAFFELDRDPWETTGASPYFGAALAALAVGNAAAEYRARPEVADLIGYLQREYPAQSLHNRLFALWASTALRDAVPEAMRKATVEEIWRGQQPDGGWTNESIGPWKKRDSAPAASGSNSYSTALVAFVLEKTGVPHSNPALERALAWLRAHQDREGGFWAADSMNKQYPPDSMQVQFMRDAATSFAVLALL